MAILINWATRVISVQQADLLAISPGLFELDVNDLRLALKDIEDGDGIAFPDTHRHNTEVTLSGVTYARTFEIINGYTVEFEDVGTPYSVRCVGANHNISDVKTVNQVSLIIGNSAGLVVGGSGGPTAAQIAAAVHAAFIPGAGVFSDVTRRQFAVIRGTGVFPAGNGAYEARDTDGSVAESGTRSGTARTAD